LTLGDGYAAAYGAAWGQPGDQRWIGAEPAGQGVLAAVAISLLVTGAARPRWRRAAVIAGWMIIPVAFGWFLLTARLNNAVNSRT
jgi:dolichol kinase